MGVEKEKDKLEGEEREKLADFFYPVNYRLYILNCTAPECNGNSTRCTLAPCYTGIRYAGYRTKKPEYSISGNLLRFFPAITDNYTGWIELHTNITAIQEKSSHRICIILITVVSPTGGHCCDNY